MGRNIVLAIFFVVLVIGGYYIYQHQVREKQMAGGEVHWTEGQPTPEEKARYDKENSGDTADGQSEHKTRTARAEDAAGNPGGAVAAGQLPPAATPVYTTGTPTPTTAASAPYVATQPAAVPTSYGMGNNTPSTAPPMSDTVAANPANGMRFTGSGTYQWYRQGNLTWRVDTTSGRSCIVYATMEEWRKQIVYSHGCGRES